MALPRIVVVVNPCPLAGPVASHWACAAKTLSNEATILAQEETSADGSHAQRLGAVLRETEPDIVIAAGGDGTVRDVAQVILETKTPAAPALAIFPLGTANNVARSLGLLSIPQDGARAVERALAALRGAPRRIDLGQVGDRHFVGSFAAGMDADILATRNQLCRRLRIGRGLGGYPLYLWSCAVNLSLRRHGGPALVEIDGRRASRRVYNLLVTNTPIYAGEFRFDAENACDDGELELHLFRGAFDYLRRFPAAWRRHVHYARGDRVTPARELKRVTEVRIEFAKPVAAQLDGEEMAPARAYHVRVVPSALAVCVPP